MCFAYWTIPLLPLSMIMVIKCLWSVTGICNKNDGKLYKRQMWTNDQEKNHFSQNIIRIIREKKKKVKYNERKRWAFLPARDGMNNALHTLLRRTAVLLATGPRRQGINHRLLLNLFCHPETCCNHRVTGVNPSTGAVSAPHPLYLPSSSLLSRAQQSKVCGAESRLFAGTEPPRDYAALYLLQTKDCELCRMRITSSLRAHSPLHNNAFIYEATATTKGEKCTMQEKILSLKYHK